MTLIFLQLFKNGCLAEVRDELSDLDVITRMLKVGDKRHLLHHCFQVSASRNQEIYADTH